MSFTHDPLEVYINIWKRDQTGPSETYQQSNGSITPALLWDQFHGFKPKLRFHVNFPLPQLNDRFKAVIGRVNPNEFITERAQQSGAIARQYGPPASLS